MSVGNYSCSQRPTCRRLVWISFAKLLTFFIPNIVLCYIFGFRTSASRIAWREKITVFTLFLLAAALLCFWLEFVSSLTCTPKKLFDYRTLFTNSSKSSAIHGSVVDWSEYSSEMADFVKQYPHHDLSLDFPKFMSLNRTSSDSAYSDPLLNDCIYALNMSARADAWLDNYLTVHPGYDYQNNVLLRCPLPGYPNVTGAPCFDGMNAVNGYKTKGEVFYSPPNVKKYFNSLPSSKNSTKQAFVILNGNVLDVAAYLIGTTDIVTMSSEFSSRSFAIDRMFLPLDLTLHMYKNLGKDISTFFEYNMTENPELYRACITQLFQAGVSYNPTTCNQINPGLWATMGIGIAYFLVKINLAHLLRIPFFQKILFSSAPEFSSSLIDKSKRWPHTLLMVPCFAESSETLKQTLDNLARSGYDDSKKLLLFVCDGMAINVQAKKETFKLLLESLGHSSYTEGPIARPYLSLGQGSRRVNYAKVYSGYYETGRHRVPYLVIVKVGNPKELLQKKHSAPPGNRGKRDSLVLVFGFLERCMDLANKLITPLDYEIFNQCYNVLGIDPRYFKYLMLTDADVQVQSNVVHKLVLRLEHDCKMLAVSGHVRPANPEENLTTMIQIFPVYMDFFTGLAYEACLRSVMTINGGLVMFKIWTEKEYEGKYRKKKEEEHRLDSFVTTPKMSDEIIILNPFDDKHASVTPSTTALKSKSNKVSMPKVKTRPESHLNLVSNVNIQACCVHPTVIRGICTPQPNTMHMQNVLLLGEEKYLSIVLLTSHPGHQLGFEPDAEGYATLPSSFFSLQGLQTRNMRAAFHTLFEMNRVSWRLGFRYWIVSTFELIDTIFSTPITVYLYVIFTRSIQGLGLSYTLIACAFSGLVVIHMLMFLLRRQVKYILWFALYCILTIPIFVVWFPLLALWQSNHAGVWYDMWPSASLRSSKSRTHGIVECEDTLRQNSVNDKDSDVQESHEVVRLTLAQFDEIEIQRQRQQAEAALDINFVGFSTGNSTCNQKAKTNPESPTTVISPPLVQVRDGLHSTRLAHTHTFTHRRTYNRQPSQFTISSNFENTEEKDTYEDKDLSNNYHTYSPTSHDTLKSDEVRPEEESQKSHWEANSGTDSMMLYGDEISFNDRSSTLSIMSHTFSLGNDQEPIVHQRPIHRLDFSTSHVQHHLPEEGRRRAVHTNMAHDVSRQHNIPRIDEYSTLKYNPPSLNYKPSSNTLTHQLTHDSNTALNLKTSQEVETLIFNDIRNYLQESNLDTTTMIKVKEYLVNRYKNKIDFNQKRLDFVEKTVQKLTWKQ